MSIRTPEVSERRRVMGALSVWVIVWLVGTGAISAWSAVRHAPEFERLILAEVQESVAPLAASPVMVSVDGHRVTLSGAVGQTAERNDLVKAAAASLGVREVVDRIVVSDRTVDTLPEEADTIEFPPDPSQPVSAQIDSSPANQQQPIPLQDVETEAPVEVASAEVVDIAAQQPLKGTPVAEANEQVDAGLDVATDEITADERLDRTIDLPGDDSASVVNEPVAGLSTDVANDETTEVSTNVASDATIIAANQLAEDDLLPTTVPETETAADPETDLVTTELPANTAPSLVLALAQGVLTLDGNLQSKDDTARLVETAMSSLDLDYVSNTIETGNAIDTADWLEPLTELLPSLAQLEQPGVTIEGQQLTLSGEAPDTPTRDALVDEVNGRFDSLSLVENIEIARLEPDVTRPEMAADTDTAVAPAATLRDAWRELPTTDILFEPGSDRLTEGSREFLNRVADLLRKHPDVPIAIEGHTDAIGSRDANLRLSQLRANAVRDHLVSADIPYAQLKSYGYGEGVPIADNRTTAGRTANRRIEFTY